MSDFPAQPQPHVRRHLVIPAAPRVQLARDRANGLGQPALDEGVNVFVGCAGERGVGVALDFVMDAPEPCHDLVPLFPGQQPRRRDPVRPGNRARDVRLPQPPVERQRRVEPRHVGIHLAGEAATPEFAHAYSHLLASFNAAISSSDSFTPDAAKLSFSCPTVFAPIMGAAMTF